ncbi:lactate utilization protein [Chloroflexota bacterium]
MPDDTDTRQEMRAVYERLARRTITKFKKRGLHAEYVPDRKEALARMLEMIPPGATVGRGESVTLNQVGICAALRKRGQNEIFNPVLRDADGNPLVTGSEKYEVSRKALLADVFISGTNAITMDGKLVNTDGAGNRVAAMVYGPKKVIIVAGGNKIVKNADDAMKRIREVAAPLTAHHHYLKHHLDLQKVPCFQAGTCVECVQPLRMCAYTVIIEGENAMSTVTDYLPRIHIIIVGEQLGL